MLLHILSCWQSALTTIVCSRSLGSWVGLKEAISSMFLTEVIKEIATAQ